ncbi:MAG: hypothetical protein KKA22_11210 [Gammaproteobacteria bacterium]|nr:hypothetical protein [Gammaproteobacteria bacterium]MBU1408704.1 hypothetical protein [Gammaproteobacteria bacterium]MBU1532516.1 hypothetical protein [Gammaproteobacteria bacterium]
MNDLETWTPKLTNFLTRLKENLRRWRRKLAAFLSHTWLVGSLFRAGRKTHAGALYEFSYLLVWSILPFGLGALTLYVINDSTIKDPLDLTLSTFRNGELLVFTISMLAPILYLVLHDPEQADAFPHKLPISTTVALIIVTCAALFALIKANAVKDGDFVFLLSIVLTLTALVFRYLALVYHRLRLPEPNEQDLRATQVGFLEEYRAHVGEPELVTHSQPAADFAAAFENHLGDKQ